MRGRREVQGESEGKKTWYCSHVYMSQRQCSVYVRVWKCFVHVEVDEMLHVCLCVHIMYRHYNYHCCLLTVTCSPPYLHAWCVELCWSHVL